MPSVRGRLRVGRIDIDKLSLFLHTPQISNDYPSQDLSSNADSK